MNLTNYDPEHLEVWLKNPKGKRFEATAGDAQGTK